MRGTLEVNTNIRRTEGNHTNLPLVGNFHRASLRVTVHRCEHIPHYQLTLLAYLSLVVGNSHLVPLPSITASLNNLLSLAVHQPKSLIVRS